MTIEQRLEAAENAKELVDVIAWATGPARQDMRLLLTVAKAAQRCVDPPALPGDWFTDLREALDALGPLS